MSGTPRAPFQTVEVETCTLNVDISWADDVTILVGKRKHACNTTDRQQNSPITFSAYNNLLYHGLGDSTPTNASRRCGIHGVV